MTRIALQRAARETYRGLWTCALLVVIVLLGPAAADPAYPPLTGRVVDNANVIGSEAAGRITDKLKSLEDKSGIQLVVATVPTLGGEEIEPYANGLFRFWKLGEAKKNNGVLLLVAPKERRARIEVGYGLEGTLTDAISKIIITNAMAPRFKAGDFAGGIERGTDDIITVLTTDSSDWEKRPALREDGNPGTLFATILPFVFIAIVVFLLVRASCRSGRGGLRGGGPWIIPPPGGGWGGGGFSGGGSFSGGGGGFSGGGGSSGGGGASGSW